MAPESTDGRTELNATAASLLGFLRPGPLTGWELGQRVEAAIGSFWNVTRSQVYRELRNLEAWSLVEPGETGPRERRPYRLTEAGRRAFAEWIARQPGDAIIRFPLLLTVYFGDDLDRDRLERSLHEHELRHLRALEDYERRWAGIPEGDTSGPAQVLRFGIEYERAVLRWFAGLPGYRSLNR
jgi:DNA-binding PadR family transcriptional regulator